MLVGGVLIASQEWADRWGHSFVGDQQRPTGTQLLRLENLVKPQAGEKLRGGQVWFSVFEKLRRGQMSKRGQERMAS